VVRRRLREEPSDFDPLIEYAIQYAVKEFRKELEDGTAVLRLVEDTIYHYCVVYLRAIVGQYFKFKNLVEALRQFGAFFLVGAGVSFESELPIARHMGPLVFPLLTRLHPKTDYADWESACTDPSSSLIRADCWKQIKDNPEILDSFKLEFKRLSDGKDPVKSHELIVKYFIDGKILELICLNWDSLIEREYEKQTGIRISKISSDGIVRPHSLWKLHGDVEDIHGNWILPHEEGQPFMSLVMHLNSLTSPVFVIIGYSEREIRISGDIISKVEPLRQTFRIRPDINPLTATERDIASSARYAMKKIDELMSS